MARTLSSDATTEGIRIQVEPQYLSEYSKPEQSEYFFGYHVKVSNESNRWTKLLSRRWVIIDADGKQQVVEGEGVIGVQPELEPGQTYEYASACPLGTEWGTMEGSYRMIWEDGVEFDVTIARFYLAVPRETSVEQQ